MAGDERSLIEFGYYREGLQRFEYFIVGVSLALCAYVGQTLRPEKLTLSSAYTIEVVSLALIIISAAIGFKRIESLVQLSRLNAQLLDAKEKQWQLITAIPNAKGLIVNAVTGDVLDLQAAANWKNQLQNKIKLLEELVKTEKAKASRLYTRRNALLLVGFCGLV